MPNVAILGTEGSGKTVLITAMAKAFGRTNPQNIFLNPRTGRTAKYVERVWGYLARGEWPPSTPQGELSELHWRLRVPECVDCELKLFDVAGQDLRRLFGQEQIQAIESLPGSLRSLAEYVLSCQVVVFLVNLGDFIGEGDAAKRLENQWALKYALDYLRETDKTRKCAVVFTQADLYQPIVTNIDGWMAAAEKYLPYLYEEHLRDGSVPVLSVSAVGSTDVVVEDGVPRRVPGRQFKCKGVTPLAVWMGRCASQLPSPAATEIIEPEVAISPVASMITRRSTLIAVGVFACLIVAPCLIGGILSLLWAATPPTKPVPVLAWDWKARGEGWDYLNHWVQVYGTITNHGASGNVLFTVTVSENGRVVESQMHNYWIPSEGTQAINLELKRVNDVKKNLIEVQCNVRGL